ncbi:telomere repeat-binding factor 2-like [Gossypium australe]|uniref:Telomere repeat-binding factor 2-like n=1 Tax=Gossypium australe TaxID=47621 RepID=A0A5B6VYQ9_9ROSI|nr:telomere repeat-binding factor 2-like [Gossypium australe]
MFIDLKTQVFSVDAPVGCLRGINDNFVKEIPVKSGSYFHFITSVFPPHRCYSFPFILHQVYPRNSDMVRPNIFDIHHVHVVRNYNILVVKWHKWKPTIWSLVHCWNNASDSDIMLAWHTNRDHVYNCKYIRLVKKKMSVLPTTQDLPKASWKMALNLPTLQAHNEHGFVPHISDEDDEAA